MNTDVRTYVCLEGEKSIKVFCQLGHCADLIIQFVSITYPREKGKEVVFLIIDDISWVFLFSFLWMSKPHGARFEISSPTATTTASIGKKYIYLECALIKKTMACNSFTVFV